MANSSERKTFFGFEKILGLDMGKRSRRWLVKGLIIGAAVYGITLAALVPGLGFGIWAANVAEGAIIYGAIGFVASKILQPDLNYQGAASH